MQILLGILDSIRRGISWLTGSITSQVFNDAVYAPLTNGSFFAFGQSTGGGSTASYQYSVDGVTWSTGTLPAASNWGCAASNGSRIVAFRSNSTTGYYSDNGTTWTATNALHGTNLLAPATALWDGTNFVITEGANGTGTVRYSTDGITWSGTSSFGGSQSTRAIGFDGTSRYIVQRGTGFDTAQTTNTFPTGWSTVTYPYITDWGNIIYGNGLWLITRPGTSSYITSPTGTGSWTQRTLPSLISELTGSSVKVKMLFNGGKFYYYYLDNVYSSSDGINWTTDATLTGGTLDNLTGWAAGPNKVIGVGYDTTSAGSSTYLNGSK